MAAVSNILMHLNYLLCQKLCLYYVNISIYLFVVFDCLCADYVSHGHFLLKPYSRHKPLKLHIVRPIALTGLVGSILQYVQF